MVPRLASIYNSRPRLKRKTNGHNGHTGSGPRRRILRCHTSAPVSVKASLEDSRSLRSAHRSRRRRMSFAMPLTTSAIATLVNARRANPSITILLFHVRERYRVSLSGSLKTRGDTRVYVSACKFVLIASSPIRRREESVAV